MKQRSVRVRPSFVSGRYVSKNCATRINSNREPKLKHRTRRLSHCQQTGNRIRARFDYVIISEHGRREVEPKTHCV
jgi:hypothetical protein